MGRTPDGQPDLQGMWTNYDPTPFERLRCWRGTSAGAGRDAADWLVQDSPISHRRSSMVVDPPNGRVPLKREAIEKRDAALRSTPALSNTTGPGSDVSPAACPDRCGECLQ